jgi:16S rRNA processing protein RimM
LSNSSWLCVGKLLRAHSLQGELFLFLFSGTADWYNPEMEIGTATLPEMEPHEFYKIMSLKKHKDGFIIKLGGIWDRDQSERLSKKFVFIHKNYLESKRGELPFLHEFLNFVVFDKNKAVGRVTGFSSNGAQDLLVVTQSEKSFEIPLVDAFILEINYQSKTIHFDLPEGLILLNEKS